MAGTTGVGGGGKATARSSIFKILGSWHLEKGSVRDKGDGGTLVDLYLIKFDFGSFKNRLTNETKSG